MKNYEKYMKEIVDDLEGSNISCQFIHTRVYHEKSCCDRECSECYKRLKDWLNEEYKPQIDWSKVPVDTPVVVTLRDGTKLNRYFAKYKDNNVYTFLNGATSWSIEDKDYLGAYFGTRNVELARPEDIEKYSI